MRERAIWRMLEVKTLIKEEQAMLGTNTLRIAARALTLAWSGWWIFFALAAAFSPPHSPQFPWVALAAVLLWAVSALLPWRREREGGALLLLEGIVLFVANFTFFQNPPMTRLFLLLTLALPPLLAGAMFLALHPHPRGSLSR
jgi:hypothetical protein